MEALQYDTQLFHGNTEEHTSVLRSEILIAVNIIKVTVFRDVTGTYLPNYHIPEDCSLCTYIQFDNSVILSYKLLNTILWLL
jgi:hypothetical protein